jgi:hypothetical protein
MVHVTCEIVPTSTTWCVHDFDVLLALNLVTGDLELVEVEVIHKQNPSCLKGFHVNVLKTRFGTRFGTAGKSYSKGAEQSTRQSTYRSDHVVF